MVRPYTPTGGRAVPTRRTLDVATLLIADPNKPLAGLDAHSHRLMQHCLPGVLSLAEVSADLQLPAAVTKVLVASLVDSGHLIRRRPVPAAQRADPVLLERVIHALRKL
ncbi:DUF742 domain-containing protein [Streptomyces sp. NPDC052415]|uniref:DUF742 domain-containing protein n=1 Tax=Streptomyces sp. NPDC052415 TaxID=3365690 RepID=UPI0037D04A77